MSRRLAARLLLALTAGAATAAPLDVEVTRSGESWTTLAPDGIPRLS